MVLNADDPRVAAMASLAHGPVIFFSPSGRTHEGVWAEGVSIDKNGHAHFTLVHGDERASVHLALVGAHHVANAVAAAAVARVCGMTVARIAEVLSVTGPASPHRMDIRSVDGVTIIDDSYNANPDSMKAGIEALGRIGAGRRKIAVLGSMLELGEASDAEHRMLLPSLVAARAGILVTVGREMEPLAVVAKETGMDVYSAEGDREAEDLVRHLIRPDDVVLLKGSHGSGIWRIANRMSGGN